MPIQENHSCFELVESYQKAQSLHSHCRNQSIPWAKPEGILRVCEEGLELFSAAMTVIGQGVPSKLATLRECLTGIEWPDSQERPQTFRDTLVAWGRLLAGHKTRYVGPPWWQVPWETFCTNLIVEEDGTPRLKEYPRSTHHEVWMKDYPDESLRGFYQKSALLVVSIIEVFETVLCSFDAKDSPAARLAIVEAKLKGWRDAFISSVRAIGPYRPSPKNGWHRCSDFIEIDLGSGPGLLECWIGSYNPMRYEAHCRFQPSGARRSDWSLPLQLYRRPGPTLQDYEALLFRTWHYSTGKRLDTLQSDQIAHWFVDNAASLTLAANHTAESVLPLYRSEEYTDIADRAREIVTNGQRTWQPGPVEWTYIKNLDDVVASVTHAERVLFAQRGLASQITMADQPHNKECPIPAEHRTDPMSKSEMAEFFGGGKTYKDINKMIDAGALPVFSISPQKHIFDKRHLSADVRARLESAR